MSNDLALEVQKLCFSYQGNDSEGVEGEQTLEDVDLVLPKGARCLLVGANGCEHGLLCLGFSQFAYNTFTH